MPQLAIYPVAPDVDLQFLLINVRPSESEGFPDTNSSDRYHDEQHTYQRIADPFQYRERLFRAQADRLVIRDRRGADPLHGIGLLSPWDHAELLAVAIMYGPPHDCKRDRWDEVQSAQMYPALMEMNLRALDEFRACLSC